MLQLFNNHKRMKMFNHSRQLLGRRLFEIYRFPLQQMNGTVVLNATFKNIIIYMFLYVSFIDRGNGNTWGKGRSAISN
jgi:hypothetical protein